MTKETAELNLGDILRRAEQELTLEPAEIIHLLGLKTEAEINDVFTMARKLRERYFGNAIFLYGFIYFSTHCRNDCSFCFYRKSSRSSLRYRKTEAEILELAARLVESGVHLLDFTMGEDPIYFAQDYRGFEQLVETVAKVKQATGVPLMISPGVISDNVLGEFNKAGVEWYACYQETHNRNLFEKLRLGQGYEERMEAKLSARRTGFLLEEGLLAGVGETNHDVADSLSAMRLLGADQVRVMSFVPQAGTPMASWATVSRRREMLIIAVMRLIFPDKLIPASLDVDGLDGLGQRLEAGANVITSIIQPRTGLAGVSNSSLDIDEGNRTVQSILPILHSKNLACASLHDYQAWINGRKAFLAKEESVCASR